jgi:alkylation response protein AidB-like acyl-CoA dehydrogenase
MKRIEHPSAFISQDLTDQIRSAGNEAERTRNLHPIQLQIIHEQNWLNQFVPKEFGGLELSLPQGVRIEECLSWADGSVGWVATLCSGAAWFSGFLSHELLTEIFSENHVCFAGSGAPSGIARVVDTGYQVSGLWKYASGSLHATVFTANCVLTRENVPLLNDDGTPLVRAFLFKKEEVVVHRNWNSMGMVATGSHDFEVKSLRLDSKRCFVIDPKHATSEHPLYQFPFLSLAELTLTCNLSGMAVRFLDLCGILFAGRIKSRPLTELQIATLKRKLSDAQFELENCRREFYDRLDASWEICESGRIIPQAQLSEISRCSHQLKDVARRCVNELYPYCGLAAAGTDTEINRVWRNFHTASQHTLFRVY